MKLYYSLRGKDALKVFQALYALGFTRRDSKTPEQAVRNNIFELIILEKGALSSLSSISNESECICDYTESKSLEEFAGILRPKERTFKLNDFVTAYVQTESVRVVSGSNKQEEIHLGRAYLTEKIREILRQEEKPRGFYIAARDSEHRRQLLTFLHSIGYEAKKTLEFLLDELAEGYIITIQPQTKTLNCLFLDYKEIKALEELAPSKQKQEIILMAAGGLPCYKVKIEDDSIQIACQRIQKSVLAEFLKMLEEEPK